MHINTACVCVCVHACVRVCMRARACVCVCVCVCGQQNIIKVKKNAKIRNRYNQVPHLTLDIIWDSDKRRKHHTQEMQRVSPFPAGDNKAARNRPVIKTKPIVNHK